MKRVIMKTAIGDVEMLEVKLKSGNLHVTDIMTMMVMHARGLLHPDEIDEDGGPKTPEDGDPQVPTP